MKFYIELDSSEGFYDTAEVVLKRGMTKREIAEEVIEVVGEMLQEFIKEEEE